MNRVAAALARPWVKNLIFLAAVAGAYFLWPEEAGRTPQPESKADESTSVYVQEFDEDVFADPQSRWSRFDTEEDELVAVRDGRLVIRFKVAGWCGASYRLGPFKPLHYYSLQLAVKQSKTGVVNVWARPRGRKRFRQIAGKRLLPTRGDEFVPVLLEFVAPETPDTEVLIKFYQFDSKKDVGGVMVLDRFEILEW